MTEEPVHFKAPAELDSVSNTLLRELVSAASSISKLIKHQVVLLELYSHEAKKLERIGYCDYELAYVCYTLASLLHTSSERLLSEKTEDFIRSIKQALVKKKESFETIKSFLEHKERAGFSSSASLASSSSNLASNGSAKTGDPLLDRFNSLKVSSVSPQGTGHSISSNVNSVVVDSFKFKEAITAPELHSLIQNGASSKAKVLLIDFRASKDFNHNHIKHTDVVNIEPSHITAIQNSSKGFQASTDQDLEERLKLHLPQDQFSHFQNRYKYDLVVIYNLKYGPNIDPLHRFSYLKDILLNEDSSSLPTNNPFNNLVELIMFKNKYISSKLKRHPCYLTGGVFNWHQLLGDNSITRTQPAQVLTRPEASLSKGSPNSSRRSSYVHNPGEGNSNNTSAIRSSSPYLKNFGEYLSTAKSTDETPISNSFTPLMPIGSTHSKYIPAPPMKSNSSQGTYRNGISESSTSTITSPPQQQPPVVKRTLSISNRSNSVSSVSSHPSQVVSNGSLSHTPKSSATKQPQSKFLDSYVTGLVNMGNTCYMNCVLQCLAATPQLTKFFFPEISDSASVSNTSGLQSYRQHINVNNKLGSKGILTTNFVTLLANMFNNNGSSFCPTNFKKVMGSLSPGGQFATFDQQDCIEFLNFILDGLHEDLNQMVIANAEEKKAITELTPEQERTREVLPVRLASTIEWERYLKLNFSIIVDYFQGQYLSQLRCLECGLSSTTYNAFSILSLPIPEKLGYSSSQSVSLNDCLQEFTATELLDDNNKWHCPRCKKFTKSTKKITITRLPQVLIIHFKRFRMTPTGYFNKLDTFVKYPVNETLDLTSYWPKVGTSVNSNIKESELVPKEKEEQILATLPTRNQQPAFRYKLYGVANHFGNLTTGHYTSYVHKENDKKSKGWCYFDDAKITYNCKESQVLNKNAYCLFYQRI
ncbi:uncharacterized protein RJT20DRAFT_129362 [Scheffersomyces xylosifermentans]|uniref:uncharacterized protein n=1 Tax=Scheffersomyces xylosifermentans TaxID=1304137 RepID=UPI00315CFE32